MFCKNLKIKIPLSTLFWSCLSHKKEKLGFEWSMLTDKADWDCITFHIITESKWWCGYGTKHVQYIQEPPVLNTAYFTVELGLGMLIQNTNTDSLKLCENVCSGKLY